MYVLNHGPTTEWDGEAGHAYVERSDLLNAFPEDAATREATNEPSRPPRTKRASSSS